MTTWLQLCSTARNKAQGSQGKQLGQVRACRGTSESEAKKGKRSTGGVVTAQSPPGFQLTGLSLSSNNSR
jgi:hypothetical protein